MSENEAGLVQVVKDLQEIGRRLQNIRHNLLPGEKKAEDAETVMLRGLQRDLLGELASVTDALFKVATWKPGDDDPCIGSKLNEFCGRCAVAIRPRKGSKNHEIVN